MKNLIKHQLTLFKQHQIVNSLENNDCEEEVRKNLLTVSEKEYNNLEMSFAMVGSRNKNFGVSRKLSGRLKNSKKTQRRSHSFEVTGKPREKLPTILEQDQSTKFDNETNSLAGDDWTFHPSTKLTNKLRSKSSPDNSIHNKFSSSIKKSIDSIFSKDEKSLKALNALAASSANRLSGPIFDIKSHIEGFRPEEADQACEHVLDTVPKRIEIGNSVEKRIELLPKSLRCDSENSDAQTGNFQESSRGRDPMRRRKSSSDTIFATGSNISTNTNNLKTHSLKLAQSPIKLLSLSQINSPAHNLKKSICKSVKIAKNTEKNNETDEISPTSAKTNCNSNVNNRDSMKNSTTVNPVNRPTNKIGRSKENLCRAVRSRLYCRTGFYLDIDSETCKIVGIAKQEIDLEMKQHKMRRQVSQNSTSENNNSETLSTTSLDDSNKSPRTPENQVLPELINFSTQYGSVNPRASTRRENTMRGLFYLIPVGLRVVAIQHVDTGLYLALCPDGRPYCSEMYSNECKFKEVCSEQIYVSYSQTQKIHCQSNGQKMMKTCYLGLSEKGRATKGSRCVDKVTKKVRPCAQFLPHPVECVTMKEPSAFETMNNGLRED